MSAELLRRAASLMRERAEGAERDYYSRGPWTATVFDDGRAWVGPARLPMHGYPNTAEHIASWHPAAARAVADWLDHEAETFEYVGDTFGAPAFRVARAYLGEDS